jgi:competence protein ComEC
MPLIAAAAVAAASALASLVHPLAAAALALPLAVASALLAVASADRPRRVLWSAVALAAGGSVVRTFVIPPALTVDPRMLALRDALAGPLRMLVPEPESALVLGIVLGERAGIARDLRDAFAATGTAHLLAVSGSNMTLVAAAVGVVLRGRVRPIGVAATSVLAIAGYAVLVGPQPSVVRAALMAGVASLALALGRRGAATNALGGAVAAMLLADPRALEDVGFLLSVAATAGLIVWEPSTAARLAFLPSVIARGLAATIAASTPTIPIVAAVFGRVSLVSPVANLAAVPLFAPIMAFGAATAAVGALAPEAAVPLAMAAHASAMALRHVVEITAAVPLASVAVPPGPLTGAATAAALAIAWFAGRRAFASIPRLALARPPRVRVPRVRAGGPAVIATIAAAAVVVGVAAAAAVPRSAGSRLHALDVGQGDAFLLESDGRFALIDGGPDGTLLLRRLGEVLAPWQRRLDVIALTHEHADHGTGLLAVIDRFDVGLAIEPAGMGDVPLTRMWAERLARAGVPRRAVRAGAVIRVGRVTLEVLAPGQRRVEPPSLVIRASAGAGSLLFMGDATDDAIGDVLLSPDTLAAEVYVPPHHGADTVHAAALVGAARPAVAVISVGAMNRYGHPTPGTLTALGTLPVYRTDRYGTVVLDLDARPFVVHTAKAGPPPGGGGPVPRAPASR